MPRLIVIKGADEGKQFELTAAPYQRRPRLHQQHPPARHRGLAPARRIPPASTAPIAWSTSAAPTAPSSTTRPSRTCSSSPATTSRSARPSSSSACRQRRRPRATSDLAERISMITRHDMELSSAIIKTIGETEGSRILAQPEQAEGPWLKTALANLGIMYETIQAVSHILDLDQLLERIMDLIFRSIEADRGCIMLRNRRDRPARSPRPSAGARAAGPRGEASPSAAPSWTTCSARSRACWSPTPPATSASTPARASSASASARSSACR